MIDFGSVSHRISEFDKAHGASVCVDGWVLFEDGAMRESDIMGALQNPPADPWELAKRKLHFRKLILRRAVSAFDERYRHYVESARANLNNQFCGPAMADPANASDELRVLQKVVKSEKEKCDRAAAAVEKAKPSRLRELEGQNVENRAANEALLAALEKIEI